MQSYDYTIEHRSSSRMNHVDALSRTTGILVVQDDSCFDFVLAASQQRDVSILKIMKELEKGESSSYTMINGMIYKKLKDNVVRFYVPRRASY